MFDRPRWERRLAQAVALWDLTAGAHKMVGGQADRLEAARVAIVELLDEATSAGVSEAEQDEVLASLVT